MSSLSKKWYVENIEWETDGKKVRLPKEEIVECEDPEEIANQLSDMHGWLVSDYSLVAPDLEIFLRDDGKVIYFGDLDEVEVAKILDAVAVTLKRRKRRKPKQ